MTTILNLLARAEVISLRQYQQALVDAIRAALRSGKRRVMAYLPTGGGKTRVATAITQMTLLKSQGRVIILANRKQLLGQLVKALHEAGLEVGILQGDNTKDLHHRVVVASIDTVHARGCIFDDVALFIIDEAHACAGGEKYRRLLFRYNRVPCIGLSATPFARGLGKPYAELAGKPLFEHLVVGATVQELVDNNFLTDIEIYCPSKPDMTGAKTVRTAEGEQDFRQADIDEAADKPELVGDIILHWLKLAGGVMTIVFASSIAHSKHIVEQFRAAGVTAEHIDCYMDDVTRTDILDRFKLGEFTVLSNVALLSEGFDVPSTACMILARPTKSLTRFLQMVGRVLRKADGKDKALLLDHSGSVERIGHPFDDLPLELCDGKPNKAGMQERQKPEPKPCPACKFVKPAGTHKCPKCRFTPERQSEVHTTDGELQRLTRKKNAATRFEKAATYAGLLHIANEYRYSERWVGHQYKNIFGVWPRALPAVRREPSAELRSWVRAQQIRFAKSRLKQQGGRDHE